MRKTVGILLIVLCGMVAAAQTTSVASLKGNYAFQVSGARIGFGYMGSSGWVSVDGQCPKDTFCQNLTFTKLTAGVIKFNGNGTGSFVSVESYCPVGSNDGVTAGTTFTYTVSGFNATMTISVNGTKQSAALSLGSFNGNLAQSALILVQGDTDGPQSGVAVLQ